MIHYLLSIIEFLYFLCRYQESKFNEQADYDKVIESARKQKINFEYKMYVTPVSFNEHGRVIGQVSVGTLSAHAIVRVKWDESGISDGL